MANGLSDAALIVGGTAIRAALGGAKMHTGDPGTGGAANSSSAAMVVPTWTTPSGAGNFDLSADIVFSGGTPAGAATWVSLWSNTSGSGVWYGNFQMTGDMVFDSNGEYRVTSIPLTGSSD